MKSLGGTRLLCQPLKRTCDQPPRDRIRSCCLTRRHKRALIHVLRNGSVRPHHMPAGVGIGTVRDLLRWGYIVKRRMRVPNGWDVGGFYRETRVGLTSIGRLVADVVRIQLIDV